MTTIISRDWTFSIRLEQTNRSWVICDTPSGLRKEGKQRLGGKGKPVKKLAILEMTWAISKTGACPPWSWARAVLKERHCLSMSPAQNSSHSTRGGLCSKPAAAQGSDLFHRGKILFWFKLHLVIWSVEVQSHTVALFISAPTPEFALILSSLGSLSPRPHSPHPHWGLIHHCSKPQMPGNASLPQAARCSFEPPICGQVCHLVKSWYLSPWGGLVIHPHVQAFSGWEQAQFLFSRTVDFF